MRRRLWYLGVAVVLLAVLATWLWWVKPKEVDMAGYAPANCLLYLEANDPPAVIRALARTDVWKVLNESGLNQQGEAGNTWVQQFVRWTGIGPIESVILARARIAVVVTELGTIEEGDALRVKPEAALIIETQTAERRIRPAVERALGKLAELTYGKPAFRKTTVDGVEFIAWTAPQSSRQIVATIAGSLVIIGNTQQAVQKCLAVSQGRQPSLREDPELRRVRLELGAEGALTFGYVPAANSARLLSIAGPILMGRAPANSEFQRLLTTIAAKVFGSLGWSSRPFMMGIEDRFLISLQPPIVARLKPHFAPTEVSSRMLQILPVTVDSVTYYQFEDPLSTWQSFRGAVSAQTDALSAIVFSSFLKSALLSFGIDEPEIFLAAVNSEILTLRPDQSAERSLLVAGVRNQGKLRELFSKTMRAKAASDGKVETHILEDSQGEFAAGFVNELVVMGSPTDVRHFTEAIGNRTLLAHPDQLKRMTVFVPLPSSASVVTYSNDGDRVKSFISAVVNAKGSAPIAGNRMDQMLNGLPYSTTETKLGERGLERTTRSPLGQFSTLLPLLIPEQRAP